MPISRINPDGTVKIYNSKTNEVKDVAPEELIKFNPKLANDYEVLLSVQKGDTSIADLPAEQKTSFIGASQASGFAPTDTSATERTAANRYKSALDLTNKFDLGEKLKKANTGPTQGAWTKLTQNWAENLADPTLVDLESNIGPIREDVVNAISGAQVSAEEAERIKAWIPSITKSKSKNRVDLNSLTTWLQTKYEATSKQKYKYEPTQGRPSLDSFMQ